MNTDIVKNWDLYIIHIINTKKIVEIIFNISSWWKHEKKIFKTETKMWIWYKKNM